MPHIPVEPFAWWIFGYQKFSESVIRACICRDKGWKDITREVRTKPPTEIKATVETRQDWGGDLESLQKQARKALDARSRRLALDAALHDEHTGRIFIGEFKSWGGFQVYDPKVLAEDMRQGRWFPDRLAIDTVEYKGQDRAVSGFIFATNLKNCASGSYEFPLGHLRVEILDIRSLLQKNRDGLPEGVTDVLSNLKEAVKKVERYVEKGEPPSSPNRDRCPG